jgi:TetR/AcrR family transcriptional regulator
MLDCDSPTSLYCAHVHSNGFDMSTNDVSVAEPVATRKSSRRTQERTEITRAKLLEAASRLFTEHGFEGVSIRDLENAAKVQRGLLAYHFKNKKTLWKAMADATFNLMHEQLNSRLELLEDLSARERIAYIIRFYVRFSSRHPELSRLLSQEARHDSWRIRYLAENHICGLADSLRGPVIETLGLSERQFMHWYYLLAGGSSLIFSHAPECQLVFGEDAHQESVVDEHAEMMVTALLGSRA